MFRYFIIIISLLSIFSCKKQVAEGGAEQGLPSCTDGIKNQDELGIDCGGVCGNPCLGSITAFVNGNGFSANNVQGISGGSSNSLQLIATDTAVPYRIIQLFYSGTFTPGTKTASGIFSIYNNGIPKDYIQNTSTTLFISSWNTQNKIINGSFTFKGFASATDSVVISNGVITDVGYQ